MAEYSFAPLEAGRGLLFPLTPPRYHHEGNTMTDNIDPRTGQSLTPEQQEERDASHRRFLERLSDWDDPDAITLIRNGVPVDGRPLLGPPEEVAPVTPVVVVGTDEDGNLRMSDGSVVVPRP